MNNVLDSSWATPALSVTVFREEKALSGLHRSNVPALFAPMSTAEGENVYRSGKPEP